MLVTFSPSVWLQRGRSHAADPAPCQLMWSHRVYTICFQNPSIFMVPLLVLQIQEAIVLRPDSPEATWGAVITCTSLKPAEPANHPPETLSTCFWHAQSGLPWTDVQARHDPAEHGIPLQIHQNSEDRPQQ